MANKHKQGGLFWNIIILPFTLSWLVIKCIFILIVYIIVKIAFRDSDAKITFTDIKKNGLKNISHSSKKKSTNTADTYDFVTIEYSKKGMFIVQGTNTDLAQKQLKKLHQQQKASKKATCEVSLTPICAYQKQQKWPEPPFVNVNTIGSIETSADNWLGYIDGEKNETNSKILLLLQGILTKRRAIVKASTFIRNDGKIGLWVFISQTSLEKQAHEAGVLRKKIAEQHGIIKNKKKKR